MRLILAALATMAALRAAAEPAAAEEPQAPPSAGAAVSVAAGAAAAKAATKGTAADGAAADGTAARVVLYNPAAGTLPSAQGWLYLTRPLLTPAVRQKLAGGMLTLDTSAVPGDSAGYFAVGHPRMPVLDHTRGYRVRLTLRVDRETHRSAHRAGFSWLVLGDDGRGIELGFWTNEIWAQSGSDFRHAEGAALDTTARPTPYELRVAGDEYTLWTAQRKLLEGPLRSYAQHWHPIYHGLNVVFVGDDTQSAAARVELGAIEIRGGRQAGGP